MNEIQIANKAKVYIESVSFKHDAIIGDKGILNYFISRLRVEYGLVINSYKTSGTITINDNDQDTHDSLENLTINDLQFIIANRLGVYKDSGDDDNA